MSFKKTVSWILCLAIALTMVITPAWAAVRYDDGEISVQYVKTRRITATLTLQDGVATCTGKLYPLDDQACSITVKHARSIQWILSIDCRFVNQCVLPMMLFA